MHQSYGPMSSHEEVVVEHWSFLFKKSGMVRTNLHGRRDGLRLFLWDQNNQNYIVSSQHQVQLVFDSSSLIPPLFCLSSDPGQESPGQLSLGWYGREPSESLFFADDVVLLVSAAPGATWKLCS